MHWSTQILLVSFGGAVGALARFGISRAVEIWFDPKFPFGTLLANLIGCFLIGLMIGSGRGEDSESLRLGFGVGFLGALTTFSTFSAETHKHLTTDGEMLMGLGNVGINVICGLLAVAAGILLVRQVGGTTNS